MPAVLQDTWQKASRTGTNPAAAPTHPTAALLTGFAVLRFSGSDVLNFLQGYLTVDTAELGAGSVRLTALTNLQGRVVADGWCASPRPDELEWTVHESVASHVAGFLQRYLAFSRTSLETRRDDHLVIGLLDPDRPPSVQVVDDDAGLRALLETRTAVPADQWWSACIDTRLAVVSRATSELFLPQMLGLVEAGAVDFDKGCYLGQEVVARAQHRGEVKRGLVRLEGPMPLLPAGAPLTDAGGRSTGTVISAVTHNAAQRCLAVVRLPATEDYLANGSVLRPC